MEVEKPADVDIPMFVDKFEGVQNADTASAMYSSEGNALGVGDSAEEKEREEIQLAHEKGFDAGYARAMALISRIQQYRVEQD